MRLRKKAKACLEYLQAIARVETRFVSRQELLEHVWKLRPDTATRCVECTIREIRRVLGRDAIKTHRLVGYRYLQRGEGTAK